MSDRIFDKAFDVLGTSLNFRQLRQNIITSNIANADTPGFKSQRLAFEKALQSAADTEGTNRMSGSSEKHFLQGGGGFETVDVEIFDDPDVTPSNDLNTVDVEKEMTKLAGNQIMYDAATRLINKKMAMLKYAISEGGK